MAKIVIGRGWSDVKAIRDADGDTENWHACQRHGALFAAKADELAGQEEAWCVVVDVDAADLDRDPATVAYAEYRP